MQIESLQVFCDVVRQRSFSQAAAANGVSQSAASQIVSQLEERLGVQLLDRGTRPLQLTPVGKTYYEGCKSLVEQYQDLEAAIRKAQTEIETSLEVAAIYSVGLGDMGQYVERFRDLQPQTKVHVEYLHPDRVYEKVLDGSADLGLVSFPRRSRELTALPWREEEMVLACSPQHPLAKCKAIKPGQLNGEKFVGFDKGLTIRRELDRFLRDRDVAVEVTVEFDNIENIKKAVEIGAGAALLPEPTLRREVEAGTLAAIPLSGRGLHRPLGIIHRRRAKLGSAAHRFIELLRGHAGDAESNGGNHRNGTVRNHTKRASKKTGAA